MRPWVLLALVILFWAVTWVPGLFYPCLLDDADSVHAQAGVEMAKRGDYVTLYANGIRYLDKAPLMYWGMALMVKFFGVSEWQVRLPLAVGMLGLLLATFALGRRIYGLWGGFFSALVLATAVGPYLFTRFIIPDVIVGMWLVVGMDFFLRALDNPTRFNCWMVAVCAALGTLTKGLIGVVFTFAIIVVYLLVTGNLKLLFTRLHLWSSTAIFFVVAAPWHIAAIVENPGGPTHKGFFWFYFINEQLYRYLNKRVPRDYDKVPLVLFWAMVLIWLLPWAFYIVGAIRQAPAIREWRSRLEERQRASLLFLIWALVVLVFFSFSTRQEYYTIPALPALALLLGGFFAAEIADTGDSRLRRLGRISSAAFLAVGLAVAALCSFFLITAKTPPPGVDLAALLEQHPEMYALSFGHFMDLTPQAMGVFRWPLLGTAVAFGVGAVLNFLWRRRGQVIKANLALAGMMVLFLFCAHAAYGMFYPTIGSKPLAEAVNRVWRPGDIIEINTEYENGSTLNFYTQHQVRILNGRNANLWFGSFFPDAPQIFDDDTSFQKLWDGERRVFLWVEKKNWPKALAGRKAFVVAESGGKQILSNRP